MEEVLKYKRFDLDPKLCCSKHSPSEPRYINDECEECVAWHFETKFRIDESTTLYDDLVSGVSAWHALHGEVDMYCNQCGLKLENGCGYEGVSICKTCVMCL